MAARKKSNKSQNLSADAIANFAGKFFSDKIERVRGVGNAEDAAIAFLKTASPEEEYPEDQQVASPPPVAPPQTPSAEIPGGGRRIVFRKPS